MFNTVKNIRATLFFRASASCSKILNDKKYMFKYSEKYQGNSVFQGKHKLLKNSECKIIFHTAKHFGATLFFRASASCSNILNDKKFFNTVKNSRATPFFRESANCSKILNNNIKIYIRYCEFRGPSVFQGSACKLLKTPECKKYIQYSEKF